MIHCRRVLSTQALYSGTLECSASLLFDQTLLVCRESVVVAFPTRLLISVSRERLSGIVEPKYTNSWTASSSVVCDVGGCSITCVFLRLMASPKVLASIRKAVHELL